MYEIQGVVLLYIYDTFANITVGDMKFKGLFFSIYDTFANVTVGDMTLKYLFFLSVVTPKMFLPQRWK